MARRDGSNVQEKLVSLVRTLSSLIAIKKEHHIAELKRIPDPPCESPEKV